MNSPNRLYTHPCSDNQLAILDHLFLSPGDSPGTWFGLPLSTPYARYGGYREFEHDVKELLAQTWIECEAGQLRLSQLGFEVWQQERNPDWQRWCLPSVSLDKQSRQDRWHIVGGSKNVLIDFIELARCHGVMARSNSIITIVDTKFFTRHGHVCRFTTPAGLVHMVDSLTPVDSIEPKTWWSHIVDCRRKRADTT